jgi:ubiquinone/menaquinone biosynthesis C-methylase UbiE
MAYTAFDRFVASRRFREAAPHIRSDSRVCDVGCGAGAPFLHHVKSRLACGVGLDEFAGKSSEEKISIVRADITARLPLEDGQFDHVTMLALLEHLIKPEGILVEAFRILRPEGSLIMTWPSSAVDPILSVLTRIGMVNDELGFEQHQKRIGPEKLEEMLRRIGFTRILRGKFELGLNNWLVAYKSKLNGR